MKRHPFDLVSFVPGVLAVGIAVLALADGLTVDLLTTDWVWPAVLVALGLLVLATAGIGRRAPQAPEGGDTELGDTELGDAELGSEPGGQDDDEEWPAG